MTKTEWLFPDTPLFYTKDFPFGLDGLLLASFSGARKTDRALDLGCGCGVVSAFLLGAKHVAAATALDAQPAAISLVEKTAAASKLNLEAVCADWRDFSRSEKYDVVLCNPPWFPESSPASPNAARDAARRQRSSTLGDVCAAAARNLKQRGRFISCVRPDMLAELFHESVAHNLQPKRLCLVYNTQSSESPWLALTDARYGAKPGGLNISSLALYAADGKTPTDALARVYRGEFFGG